MTGAELLQREGIIFKTFTGSFAHGSNIDGDVTKVVGIYRNTLNELLGADEDVEMVKSDDKLVTLYSLSKFVKLLLSTNISAFEMLGCREEDYSNLTEEGQLLISNSKLFLSNKVARAYEGYAKNVLERIEDCSSYSQERLGEYMSEVIRIYATEFDILNGNIKTFRSEEQELLREIRDVNGKYFKDGKPSDVFYSTVDFYRACCLACERNVLPDVLDYEAINKLVVSINRRFI